MTDALARFIVAYPWFVVVTIVSAIAVGLFVGAVVLMRYFRPVPTRELVNPFSSESSESVEPFPAERTLTRLK